MLDLKNLQQLISDSIDQVHRYFALNIWMAETTHSLSDVDARMPSAGIFETAASFFMKLKTSVLFEAQDFLELI